MEKASLKREIIDWIKTILVAVIVSAFIVNFVGQIVKVDGHSMETTLQNGDRLICERISYRLHDPERFDIVVIYPDDTKNAKWIKRVIGLPGETVRIDQEGKIFINGEVLEESYGAEIIQNPGLASQEIILGEDEYWVMGDNRNHSTDSRVIGPVPEEQIVGKAILRILPFNNFGVLNKE